MTENTHLTTAQAAAQQLLARTQGATRQFIETVSDSTERFSHEVTTTARGAVGQVSVARERVAGDVRSKAEPTAEQINNAVGELIAWARRNSDRLVADLDELRTGIEARLAPLTVVTKADLAALEARLAETERALAKAVEIAAVKENAATSRSKPATKKSAAQKSATRKPGAQKSATRKPAAKKAPGKGSDATITTSS